MRRAVAAAAAVGALVAAFLVSGALASHGGPGFKTAKPSYLQPVAPGVVVDPILSVGDTVPGTGSETQPPYQMTGIPDGLGAYKKSKSWWSRFSGGGSKREFVVVMNHETGVPFPNMPPGVNTRISRLVIDQNRRVHDAEYLFTGFENYSRFCSSTLRIVGGKPWYFTGEEAVDGGHFGSSVALDPETGAFKDTRHFGMFQHENVVPLRLKKWVFLTSEDDFRIVNNVPTPSYLYAWIGRSFEESIRGREGRLYVWKADNTNLTGNPGFQPTKMFPTKNVAIPGRFVPLSQVPDNANDASLKAASTRENAFAFERLEDIAVHGGTQSPSKEHLTYIADTGKPSTRRGRIYKFEFDRNDPTRATLTMILNGDGGDDIFNPDNMDASDRVLMIQEDRESPHRGDPSRVLAYDFGSKRIRTIANVRTPDLLGPFQWESSGIIDASHVLGKDWWLLDVQAHLKTERQPGPSLVPDSGVGEDGQLLAMKVPGSQGGGDDDDDDDDDRGDDDDDD
jgi:hypothetical protein